MAEHSTAAMAAPSSGPGPSNYYQYQPQPHHPHHHQPQHQHHPHQHPPHGAPPYPYAPAPYPGQYHQYPHPMNGHAHPMHRPFHHHPSYNYPQHPLPHSHSPAPYPPHSAPYSPTYPVHTSPSWQQHQPPLSPLPKQLSTLPSLALPPPHHHQSQDSSLSQNPTSSPQSNKITNGDQIGNQNKVSFGSEDAVTQTPLTPASSLPPSTPSPQLSSTCSTSSRMSQPRPTADPKLGGWVIWSKRPSDPSAAPGIIISPHARPPPGVIKIALNIPTPPPSPPPEPHVSLPSDMSLPQTRISAPTPSDHANGTESTTTPALSTAPDTPVPGSPVSTNTSFSFVKAPEENLVTSSVSLAAAPESTLAVLDCAVSLPDSSTAAPDSSAAMPEPSTLATEPNGSSTEPSISISTEPGTEPEVSLIPSEGVPVPSTSIAVPSMSATAPTPAPASKSVQKSWASLLRTPGSSNLPTSSVVGFSIPASPPPTTTAPKAASHPKKSELLTLLNSSASSASGIRIRPRGLVNSGNLCFANAVLQVLVYCPPFWRFFTDLGRLLQPTEESKTPLVGATIRFVKEFAPREKVPVEGKGKGVDRYDANGLVREIEEDTLESFMPTYVHDALKEKKRFDHMRGGHQEDAEEFLGFYLDTLEEELITLSSSLNPNPNPAQAPSSGNAAKNNVQEEGWLEVGKRNRTVLARSTKTVDSPMTRIFGGKFRYTLRVPHQKDSVMVEDWRSLRLDIQRDIIYTIKDALAHISSPQSVQVTSVTRPGATIDALQQIHIESLPPILILHLKRFFYDAKKGGVAKVGKQVAFTPELDVGSEVMVPGRKVHATRYRLFGAVYHHGLSASGGHYTLDVLHPNVEMTVPPAKPREGWIRIDDELVSDVRAEDVFGPAERDDRCAYLLFYRKVGGTRTL